MDYKTKVKHAEVVASKLQENVSVETIKTNLKEDGLYDNDINKIMVSARKILGEKYQPKIREYLLIDQQIHGSDDFKLLDNEIIDVLIAKESQSIALREKQKITKLIKEGTSPEEVYKQVDKRFLDPQSAEDHINKVLDVKKQNSGNGRTLNILGGLGLIALTVVLLLTTDRLFYVLPILGLIMIFKGFMTQKMDHDT